MYESWHVCFAFIWFGSPPPSLLASKGKLVPALWVREMERGLFQLRWRGGQDPNKMTAKKIWQLCVASQRRLCRLYNTVFKGGGGTDKWGRKLECWPWLASCPAQLGDSGPVGSIFTIIDAGKGNPCCLTCQELLSCKHLAIPAAGIHHIVVWVWRWSAPTL